MSREDVEVLERLCTRLSGSLDAGAYTRELTRPGEAWQTAAAALGRLEDAGLVCAVASGALPRGNGSGARLWRPTERGWARVAA